MGDFREVRSTIMHASGASGTTYQTITATTTRRHSNPISPVVDKPLVASGAAAGVAGGASGAGTSSSLPTATRIGTSAGGAVPVTVFSCAISDAGLLHDLGGGDDHPLAQAPGIDHLPIYVKFLVLGNLELLVLAVFQGQDYAQRRSDCPNLSLNTSVPS